MEIGELQPLSGLENVPVRRMGTHAGDRSVLLVCPTMWDLCEVPRAAAVVGCDVISFGTDVSEHLEGFDALDFVERAVAVARELDVDGVIASDDYPGSILAAVVARRLGLPGPDPDVVVRCQHKYYSRLAQRECVPEAVPDFMLVDADGHAGEAVPFPVFVKPVKSFFSLFAQEVAGAEGLREVARQASWHLREFVRPFDQLRRACSDLSLGAGYLLAEAPLRGRQVTVEGCLARGEGFLIGITDSVMYAGTISFERFEYPSTLDPAVQERMAGIAFRLMRSVGFDDGIFNVEMFHDDERDTVHIIEVNPRMCPQFADLMEKVNGVNTYEIAFAIATGRRPVVHRPGRPFRAAASFAMRLFEDRVVSQVPDQHQTAAFQGRFPDARLKVLCRPGHRLSEELQDGKSFRYAVLNVGGGSHADARARFEEALMHLPFAFEAVPAEPDPGAA